MSQTIKLFVILVVLKSINCIDETKLLAIIQTNFVKGLLVIFNPGPANDSLYAKLFEFGYSIMLINPTMNLNLNFTISGYLLLGFDLRLVQNLKPDSTILLHLDTNVDDVARVLHNARIRNIHFISNDKYLTTVQNQDCDCVLIESKIQITLKPPNWNFNGCVVKILTEQWRPSIITQTFHDPDTFLSNFSDGRELRFVRLIAEKLNYNINFYTKPGHRQPYEYQQLLSQNPQYDMLVLPMVPTVETHRNFSYSTFLGNCLCIRRLTPELL